MINKKKHKINVSKEKHCKLGNNFFKVIHLSGTTASDI